LLSQINKKNGAPTKKRKMNLGTEQKQPKAENEFYNNIEIKTKPKMIKKG
jgi:hypothetical protein